ncbi:MAG: methionyl-tRNA formyltransferase [Butyricicoccus sp.]|nr:methionyl-tRNA formyltransferase [Butyricicoccus sp.]
MRMVFMGTPDFAVNSLERLIADGHDIVGVFTQPDKPRGRKMKLTPPPVKQLALTHNIPVFQPDTFKNESQLALLQELNPEVIVVVAYGKLLPGYVLDLPKYGCINVHGSLLPKYRGAAPVQWMVLNGETTAGVTTMYMDRGLDTGDILLVSETKVGENETAGELFDRLAAMGADLISETIKRLPEGIERKPQDDGQSTYVSVLDKKMSVVDWSKSAQEVHNLIRGLDPWPVAVTTRGEVRLKLFQSRLTGKTTSLPAGSVTEADPKTGLFVACGDGQVLQITEIQMVGKKRMPAGDYLRGHGMEPGTVLGC